MLDKDAFTHVDLILGMSWGRGTQNVRRTFLREWEGEDRGRFMAKTDHWTQSKYNTQYRSSEFFTVRIKLIHYWEFYLIEVFIWKGTFSWKPHMNSTSGSNIMSNWRIFKTIENKGTSFLFLAISHNQCSQLPTDSYQINKQWQHLRAFCIFAMKNFSFSYLFPKHEWNKKKKKGKMCTRWSKVVNLVPSSSPSSPPPKKTHCLSPCTPEPLIDASTATAPLNCNDQRRVEAIFQFGNSPGTELRSARGYKQTIIEMAH